MLVCNLAILEMQKYGINLNIEIKPIWGGPRAVVEALSFDQMGGAKIDSVYLGIIEIYLTALLQQSLVVNVII